MKYRFILLCLGLSACLDKKISQTISPNPDLQNEQNKGEVLNEDPNNYQNIQEKVLREPASDEKIYNFENHKIVDKTPIINAKANEEKAVEKIEPIKTEIKDVKPIENKVVEEKKLEEKIATLKTEPNKTTFIVKPIDYNKYNKLSIEPFMFFTNFKFTDLSTNEKGTIVSRSNLGFTVSWLQNWGTKLVKSFIKENKISDKKEDALIIESNFVSKFFISYKKYIFINPEGSTLTTNTKDLFTFGTAVSYAFLKNLNLDFAAYYGQDIYFKSFTFDDANLFGADISVRWTFLDLYPYKLGFSIGSSFARPDKVAGSYNAKDQLAYRGSLYLLYNTIKCELGYELINKDSDYFEQKQSNILFKFGMNWAF